MAHGFLSYEEVSGDRFWQNAKWLRDKLKDIRDAKIWPLSNKKLVNAHVSELQNLLGSGKPGTAPVTSQTKMLGAGSSGGLVGKNPTNIDVKTGERPQSGPRSPSESGGGPSLGGEFVNIAGISSAGLNAENFFQKAQTGVGDSGEYLTKAQRIADFRKSQEMRSASANAPSISPDSGVDIVAAVNRNTQMIVSLVEAVKAQTKNDSSLVEKQIQARETLMLRAAAREEEAQLEQGGDYSGFMTPENFEKKKKQEKKKEEGSKLKEFFRGPNPFKKDEGCGCSPFMPGPGGRGPILGGPPGGGGLPIPDYVDPWRDMNRRRGSRLGGGASVMRRGGGTRALTRAATKIGGKGLGKAVGKGLAKKIPGVGVLAGGAFAAERAMKGDWLGAGGELLSGVASLIPGLGTAVSTGIDAGLAARDAGLTPFANGGIITQPVAGLVGEAGNEGIFPLEGKRGEKTFRMFGEGIFQAQKDNDKDFAKLQSMGLKQYYEREGGFKKMGEGLKDFFSSLAGGIASLFGGNANAATLDGAGDYLGGGDFSGNNAQDQAMNFFMSQGMTKEQAAGIVGNLMQESGAGLDPNAKNATGHRGIAQWDANRWAGFERFAKQKGLDVNTREAQLQWIMEEMRTGSGGLGIKRFKQTKTAAEAAALFVKDYERSGEKPGHAGYDNRIRNANALASRQISGGGGMEAPDPEGGGGNVVKASHPDTGSGWTIPGAKDASGRPPVFSKGGAMAFARMMKDSKGVVKPSDIASSQRSAAKNAAVGGAAGSKHLKGNAMDIHGSSQAWIRKHGKKYGWHVNDYPGSHGGHFDFKGGGGGSPAPASSANSASGGGGGGTTMSPIFQRAAAPVPASAANPNTGTPMMATSQQVAMASMGGGAAPTVINNYYTSTGGNGGGGVNPNGVSPGIGMEQTGTAIFQDLRIRALA